MRKKRPEPFDCLRRKSWVARNNEDVMSRVGKLPLLNRLGYGDVDGRIAYPDELDFFVRARRRQ
jgi:hypothetical protein